VAKSQIKRKSSKAKKRRPTKATKAPKPAAAAEPEAAAKPAVTAPAAVKVSTVPPPPPPATAKSAAAVAVRNSLVAVDTNSPIRRPFGAPNVPPGVQWQPTPSKAVPLAAVALEAEAAPPNLAKPAPASLAEVLDELDAQLVISQKVDAAAQEEIAVIKAQASPDSQRLLREARGSDVVAERAALPTPTPALQTVESVIERSTDNVTEYLTWKPVDVEEPSADVDGTAEVDGTPTVQTEAAAAEAAEPLVDAEAAAGPGDEIDVETVKRCSNCVVC
jgi:hypothetical protein